MARYGDVADEARDVVMNVLLQGDVKGKSGWEAKGGAFHAYRALRHIGLFFIGDKEEDHLKHALTRLAMAYYLVTEIPLSQILSDEEFTGYGDDG